MFGRPYNNKYVETPENKNSSGLEKVSFGSQFHQDLSSYRPFSCQAQASLGEGKPAFRPNLRLLTSGTCDIFGTVLLAFKQCAKPVASLRARSIHAAVLNNVEIRPL